MKCIRCPKCNKIIVGDKIDLTATRTPCPECGDVGSVRELWPRIDILSLTDDVDLSSLDDEQALPIKAILYVSVFDFLFEDFLSQLLLKMGMTPIMVEVCMESTDSFSDRLGLFRKITGQKFKDFEERKGFKEFGKKFRELKEQRNNFVHKTFSHNFSSLTEHFEIVERGMLPLFVALNNDFLATS